MIGLICALIILGIIGLIFAFGVVIPLILMLLGIFTLFAGGRSGSCLGVIIGIILLILGFISIF